MKYFYIAVAIFSLGACTQFSEEAAHRFILADMLMAAKPDSALHILSEVVHPEELQAEQYATYCLLYTTAQVKAHKPLLSDSLINIAVKFFNNRPGKYARQLAEALFYYARVCHETDRRDEAMQIYLEVEPRAEALQDYNLLGLINTQIARLFRYQNNSEQALVRYKQSAAYFRQANNLKNEGLALLATGYTHLFLKQYDSVVACAQQAREISYKIADSTLLPQALMTLGMAYSYLDNIEAVKLYLQEAITLEKDERKLVQAYAYLTEAYIKDFQFEEARFYAQYTLKQSEEGKNVYGLCNGNWYLYCIERDEGHLKDALSYYQEYSRLKDSIAVLEGRNSMLAIQEKYNTEKWKTESMRLMAKQQYTRLVYVIGSLAMVLLFLIFMLYRSRNKQNMLKHNALVVSKKNRLKEFLLKRLDVSKEVIALVQNPATDPEKMRAKLKAMVDTLTFDAADKNALIATVNELFNGFADKLLQRYPNLTADELQLCCMIRSGFDAGIMSTVMGVNMETIYKKRSRLRKKINMEKEADFEKFLMKF